MKRKNQKTQTGSVYLSLKQCEKTKLPPIYRSFDRPCPIIWFFKPKNETPYGKPRGIRLAPPV